MRRPIVLLLALAGTAAAFPPRLAADPGAFGGVSEASAPRAFAAAPVVAPGGGSAFALPTPGLELIVPGPRRGRSMTSTGRQHAGLAVLSAERARILLRSLTVPGWGQASLGRSRAAAVFLVAETGVWASFAAFRIQQQMRRDSYELTARLDAGIDMKGRDEEYRRIVGAFMSSEEYNRYVVFRDAANLYYDEPAKYRAYIAEHEVRGSDAWSWSSVESLMRYRAQRKDSQRAAQRANTALAVAVANRLVSAIHAARYAGRPAPARAWDFEVAPTGGDDATAFRFGVRARF
jgi:hypothetical protein